MPGPLETLVRRVVRNGNCSGCGACTLISPNIDMRLDEEGYLRPGFVPVSERSVTGREQVETDLFRKTCPGVSVRAVKAPSSLHHPTFGNYLSAWSAWAIDDEVRHAGSSGGILTALSAWLIDTDRASGVVGSRADSERPNRTVPVRIMSRDEALASSGSRYAPVSNATLFSSSSGRSAFVGKPCEVTAVSQFHDSSAATDASRPILLSFFCAGTPSQKATDSLANELGVPTEQISALRYRGNGWPGNFEVRSVTGTVASLSYDDSWGKHLGRQLQWRCKICVDGTGGHADISVGDFWNADEHGYPVFDDKAGVSVAIARTARGEALLHEAAAEGIISLQEIDLDDVSRIQPLQAARKRTLVGRLFGRLAAGKSIPRYRGYHLFRIALRAPRGLVKSTIGTFLRTLRP